jgi:ADP-ribose pyrophosphatase YjhB (NUDIX family)
MTARHCLACGGRLRPAWEGNRRRSRCVRCGWIFYRNPVPAAIALIVRRGRVLLTLRARPPFAQTWDLPGGFLEEGETPEAGLRRELREELGMRVRRARLAGYALDRYGPKGFPILAMIYRVVPVSTRVSPADDVAEARWFARDELPMGRIAFAGVRRALRVWARGGS